MNASPAARIGVIVQARRGSTRLPGKVLMPLGGRTVLAHVLERCAAIAADVLCCAIPAGADDDPVAAAAERAGAVVFRGSEDDVLDRYCEAAAANRLDVVVRVTADCPLLDPAVCRQLLDLFLRAGADYGCNNQPPSWPHGLDCEVMTVAWLRRAGREAAAAWQREHVTPWIRAHPAARRVNLPMPAPSRAEQRWTLDHGRDYAFLRAIHERLPAGAAGWDHRSVLAIVDADPSLTAINAGYDRLEGLRRSQAAEPPGAGA